MALAAPVLVDGLNVAWWCGSPPSLRLPLTLAVGLLGQGHRPRLVFDASTPHQLPEEEHPIHAAMLGRADLAVQVPSGEMADTFLLAEAKAQDGRVISRDRFRDHRRRYKSVVRNPERRFDGFVSDDLLQVPTLDLRVPLAACAESAWAQLCAAAPAG